MGAVEGLVDWSTLGADRLYFLCSCSVALPMAWQLIIHSTLQLYEYEAGERADTVG